MMYGAMWSSGIQIDTRFFALAACMLGHMRLSILDFTFAIRNLVHYLAARKRIQVSMRVYSMENKIFVFIDFSSS
jgi:hypothetical protein